MEHETKIHSVILDRFTACFSFVFDVAFNNVRCTMDKEEKMLCIYAAKRQLEIGDGILSTYYRINVEYMRNKMEDVSIRLLMDAALREKIGKVRLYWELETNKE